MKLKRLKNFFSIRKSAYVDEHFLKFSDAKLAKALNVDKKSVRDYLVSRQLVRSSEEEKAIRDNPDTSPGYLAEIPVPDEIFPFSKKLIVPLVLAFLVTFGVFLRTLAPTVTAEDSGELVTAAYSLGIAHPPGYPLWCLLGKLFSVVIPFGDVAYRVNLMSAFWSAAAAALLLALIFKFTGNIFVSIGAALAFSFLQDVWGQSVIAEVYSLNVFLIIVMLLLVASYYQRRDFRLVYLSAFISGLALSHHNSAAPAVFLSWMFFLYISPMRLIRPKSIIGLFLLLLLGLSVYLYLPIRSAANPPMDWGNPETLSAFLDHIGRRQYAFGYTEHPRSFEMFSNQISLFIQLAASQASPALILLALGGLAFLWRKDKRWPVFFSMMILIGGPLLIFVINFELEREAVETIRPFFIPVYLAACILSAVCIKELIELIPRTSIKKTGYCLFLLFPVLLLFRNYKENDKSRYFYAYDFGKNLLATVEKDGIIFTSSDHATFPLIYFQSVERLREDMLIADKYGYIQENLYADMPEKITQRFRKIPTPQERHIIENWILSHTSRPVFFTEKRDMQDLPECELIPWGITYKMVKKADTGSSPKPDLWEIYNLHSLAQVDDQKDYSAHLILCDYYFGHGVDYLYEGKKDLALQQFELVAKEGWGVKEVFNNLGSACAENSMFKESISYFEKAIQLDPKYELALRNLGRLYAVQSEYKKALDCQRRLLEIRPNDLETMLSMASLYENTKNFKKAVATYEEAARLAPDDYRAYRSLGYLYLTMPSYRKDAAVMLSRSLNLNPNQPDVENTLNDLSASRFGRVGAGQAISSGFSGGRM